MRKIAAVFVLALATCMLAIQPLTAQKESGPGGIIDWIHRLSGPSMLGPAASYSWELREDGPRFRFEGALRFPVGGDEEIGEAHSLNMFSLQPSVEFPLFGPFELKSGINVHRFGGRGHKAVWHLSFPLYGQFRFPVDSNQRLFLRIAAGIQYFPAFGYQDFGGEIRVNRRNGEGTFALQAGLDFMK